MDNIRKIRDTSNKRCPLKAQGNLSKKMDKKSDTPFSYSNLYLILHKTKLWKYFLNNCMHNIREKWEITLTF